MPTMQFTGASVGTIDFNDNVNCQVASPGWVPAVSKRKKGAMGNQSLYEDVVETIPLRVFSEHATPATARQAVMDWLHDLSAALDQAEEWYEGMNAVTPVLFEFTAEDSSLASPLKAAVLGVPENAPSVFEFQGSFNKGLQVYEIFIDLTFKRRGQLLDAEETRSRATSTSFNPGVMTPSANFSQSLTIPGPYKLSITYNGLSGPPAPDITVLTARSSGRLVLVQGESGSGTNFASAADADASGGNVGRYTPADTDPNTVSWSVTINSDIRTVFLVVHLKNRSSTISYDIRAHVESGTYGRLSHISADNNDPQIITLGPLVSPHQAIGQIELEITADGIGAAAHSLDIDAIAVLAAETTSNILTARDAAGTLTSPIINHAYLEKPTPIVTDGTAGLSHDGVADLLNSGNTAAALVLGGTAGSWRLRDDVAGLLQVGATWVRRPAYLVPV